MAGLFFTLLGKAKEAILSASKLPEESAADSFQSALKQAGCSWGADGKGEPPEQDDTVSLAFRQVLEEHVVGNNRASKSAVEDPLVMGLLDLSLNAALQGLVPKQLPMMCIHDLFEGLTARRCGDAFAFLEERIVKLQNLTQDKLSQAALLKSCNTLLQRLSKSSDLLLCGRILMFLANVLPLSEKSGVNLKGEFNKANITDFEEELTGEEKERMESLGQDGKEFMLQSLDDKLEGQLEVSFNIYKTFWGLQKWLHEPLLLLTAPEASKNMDSMTSSMGSILDNFSAYTLSDVEAAAASGAEREFYFPGFLTSTRLISLELQDTHFRRHVLVQYLIVLGYLLDSSLHPPKSLDINKRIREELSKLQNRSWKLLEGIPPRGEQFVASLRRVLDRESNWASWKKDKCPDFSKPALDDKPEFKVGVKRKQIAAAANLWKRRYFTKKVRDTFADEALEKGSLLEVCKPKDREDPDKPENSTKIMTRMQVVREQMDPENCIEEEYRHNNNTCWCWITLRMLAAYEIEYFTAATAENKFLEGAVNRMDGKDVKDADNINDDEAKEGKEKDKGGKEAKEEKAA